MGAHGLGAMKQLTLAAVGFERYAKTTRRAVFLAEMERVMPWSALCGLIAPVYPKPGNGRPPVGVERMLRIYFLQQWFNLSDPAVEEALWDPPRLGQPDREIQGSQQTLRRRKGDSNSRSLSRSKRCWGTPSGDPLAVRQQSRGARWCAVGVMSLIVYDQSNHPAKATPG
jgi:hypothetical protein